MISKALSAPKNGLMQLGKNLLLTLVRRLPVRALIAVKEHTDVVLKMDYPKGDIYLNVSSGVEYGVRLHSCVKEPETIDWIQSFFKKGDVFYDIGANVGAYSLVAAKFLDGDIKVFAFEPGFATFSQLQKNVFTNSFSDCITPLQIALTDETGLQTFNYANTTPGGAMHALGEPVDYKGDSFVPVGKQSVLAYSIDDLVEQFHIPLPNHIKIDVDGIELKILKGAGECLRDPAVKTIIIELEDDDPEAKQIIDFVSSKGFTFKSRHQYAWDGLDSPLASIYNYIFIRPG